MSGSDPRDITIIGGGPIIDSLPELGGQLAALYPEKYIYDVGGIPRILGRELAQRAIEQGLQFGADVRLEEEVRQLLREPDGGFTLVTDRDRYASKAVVIAAGKGAFAPRLLECPGCADLLGHGLAYHVKDPAVYEGQRVLLVGGGDSAVDWALALKDRTRRLVLIHRREGFRAHPHSMAQLLLAVESGRIELVTHHEVREIHGESSVSAVTIFDNRTAAETRLEIDAVVALIGFKPDLGPLAAWGLELDRHSVRVNAHMETNLPGVFAAGDITSYDGKLELIATGYAEACIAVNYAVHHIDPRARVNPGHSTNLKVFKDREDAAAEVELVPDAHG
jgi:thioredoxin reductase